MSIQRVVPIGAAFTRITGTVRGGADPSKGEGFNYVPLQQTHRQQEFMVGREWAHGLLTGTSAAQTASLRVTNNNFATGRAVIYVGDSAVVSGIDFQPGGNTTATAAAIAVAIGRLPGFGATNAANVVNVTFLPSMGEVTFAVRHHGTVHNYDQVTPSTGVMAFGTPSIGAPVLT